MRKALLRQSESARRRHICRLAVGYLLNLFDLFCTQYWVSRYGIGIESNPFGALLLGHPLSVVLYKAVAVDLLLIFLGRCAHIPVSRAASCAVVAVYGGLAAYHIFIFVEAAVL